MVIGKYKIVFYQFLPYEYKTFENYLSDMAKKGWLLISFNGLYIKFKKGTPIDLKYNVDIMKGYGSSYEDEYKDYCKAAGWIYICGSRNFQIYSNSDLTAPAIDTDDKTKFKKVNKPSFIQTTIVTILLLVLLFVYWGLINTPGNAMFLAQSTVIFGSFIIFVMAINSIISTVLYSIWYISAKKYLKQDIPIEYPGIPYTKFRIIATSVTIILVILSLICIALNGSSTSVRMFFTILILIGGFNLIFYQVRSKAKGKYRTKILILSFIVGIILVGVINGFSSVFFFDNTNINPNYKNEYPLSITSFTNKPANTNDLYIQNSSSPIAKYLFYTYGNTMQYELFESPYNWAIKIDVNKIFDTAKKYKQNIISKNLGIPSDIKTFFNTKLNEYIYISNDKVLEIHYSDNISKKELGQIVYKNLFQNPNIA